MREMLDIRIYFFKQNYVKRIKQNKHSSFGFSENSLHRSGESVEQKKGLLHRTLHGCHLPLPQNVTRKPHQLTLHRSCGSVQTQNIAPPTLWTGVGLPFTSPRGTVLLLFQISIFLSSSSFYFFFLCFFSNSIEECHMNRSPPPLYSASSSDYYCEFFFTHMFIFSVVKLKNIWS